MLLGYPPITFLCGPKSSPRKPTKPYGSKTSIGRFGEVTNRDVIYTPGSMHRLRTQSARTEVPWHCPGRCTESLQQASAHLVDSFGRTHLCLLALVRERQQATSVTVSNPQALQLFSVHSTHAAPMKAFSKFVITKKEKRKKNQVVFTTLRVIFNGNHCCTIQEPAHFISSDHVGLLLKFRTSATPVQEDLQFRASTQRLACRQQPVLSGAAP